MTGCSSVRRISPPRWGTRTMPVTHVQRVIEQSIRRIRAAGKAAGFLAVDPAMAEKCLAWGANFVAVGVDTMLYTQALDRRLAMFKSASAQPQEKTSY